MAFFTPMKKDEINYIEGGVNVRADGQSGKWKIGSDDELGNQKIEIVALNAIDFYGTFNPQKPATKIKQLWFVAAPNEELIPQDAVCYVLLKNESLSLFNIEWKKVQLKAESLFEYILIAEFEQRKKTVGNETMKWYVVNFSSRKRTKEEFKQVPKLERFIETKPVFEDQDMPLIIDHTAQQVARLEPTDY